MNKDDAVEALHNAADEIEKRYATNGYRVFGWVREYDKGVAAAVSHLRQNAALASRQTETDGLAAFDVAASAGEHLNSISDPNRLFDDRGAPYRTYNGQHVVDAFKAGAALSKTRVDALEEVWTQARENHAAYSDTGETEQDIRFFGLGLAGEAGEVANFIKKRWRDGDAHDADLKAECADVFAYNIMLADALGMSPQDLLDEVARKQQVFIAKMQARALKGAVHA